MKTNCTTGRGGSRSSKGGTIRTSHKRMIPNTNATQTPNETILDSVSDLFIALGAQMNEPHVNTCSGALSGCKALGYQTAVMRTELETHGFGDSK